MGCRRHRWSFIVPAVMRFRFILLLLCAASLSGCANVCDRMCTAQADMFERCFDSWESSWEQLSYDNRQHFEDRCHSVWGDALEDLDNEDPERTALTERCERDLQTARSDVDCESLVSIDP